MFEIVFSWLLPLLLISLIVSRTAKKNKEANARKAAQVQKTPAAPAPPPPANRPAAQTTQVPNADLRRFESLEGKAWLDEPEDPRERARLIEAAQEGEDPCHANLFSAPAENKKTETHVEHENNEWVRAIVMSEIMKRPCERQAFPGRFGGHR
jgi:hypothetical protein